MIFSPSENILSFLAFLQMCLPLGKERGENSLAITNIAFVAWYSSLF